MISVLTQNHMVAMVSLFKQKTRFTIFYGMAIVIRGYENVPKMPLPIEFFFSYLSKVCSDHKKNHPKIPMVSHSHQ